MLLDVEGYLTRSNAEPLLIPADIDLDALPAGWRDADVIAIEFASFADGRGLSLAVLLRSRLGFTGRLRACGDLIADVLPAMARCGFDEFEIGEDLDVESARTALRRRRRYYQGSVRDPLPAYRRAG